MEPILLIAYLLAFGSVILTAHNKYNHSRPLRLVSASLFILLIIVRLIFPIQALIPHLTSLAVYAAFAILQVYIWHRLKEIK